VSSRASTAVEACPGGRGRAIALLLPEAQAREDPDSRWRERWSWSGRRPARC